LAANKIQSKWQAYMMKVVITIKPKNIITTTAKYNLCSGQVAPGHPVEC
jgi:hypothetical protein